MRTANALQLRQSMGKIVEQLLASGEPILIEKGRKPVAVLISIEDYQKRFVDKDADVMRQELVASIKAAKLKLPKDTTSLDLIRGLRK